MRSAAVAVFLLLGLAAYAQTERELVRPRVAVPGEREYRNFTVPKDLEGDEEVVNKVKTLNQDRAKLREGLAAAHKQFLEAQKNLHAALAKLDEQTVAYVQFLTNRAGGGQAGMYAVRLELQPIISWLDLDEDQARQLVSKQVRSGGLKLIELRRRITEAGRRLVEQGPAKTADESRMTPEEVKQAREEREKARAEQVALLKEYEALTKQWVKNIQETIAGDPEKMKKWTLRFDRTRHLLQAAP